MPEHARRGWRRTLIAGAVTQVALVLALVWIGRRMAATGALDIEVNALRWIGEHGPLSFSTAVWLQTLGTDITLWFVVIATASAAVWVHRPIAAATIVLAYLMLEPIVRLGWLTWDRSRPDILWNGVAAPSFHSFPSGHSAKTIAVYGVLVTLWISAAQGWLERGIAALLFVAIVLLVPLARVTMGVHWPSDVVAGMLLGVVWLAFLVRALRYEVPSNVSPPVRSPATRRYQPPPTPHASPGSPLP